MDQSPSLRGKASQHGLMPMPTDRLILSARGSRGPSCPPSAYSSPALRGQNSRTKPNLDLYSANQNFQEWDSDEDNVIAKGLNPAFINKDISRLPKKIQNKIIKSKEVTK